MRQIILLAVVAIATACGGSASTSPTVGPPSTPAVPTATTSVTIASLSFTPASIAVSSGAVVTFTNNDAITHNVTFDNSSIGGSGNFSSGAKTLTMPAAAGAYTYKCTIHASMTGTVTVK
jgi:plastocyanin